MPDRSEDLFQSILKVAPHLALDPSSHFAVRRYCRYLIEWDVLREASEVFLQRRDDVLASLRDREYRSMLSQLSQARFRVERMLTQLESQLCLSPSMWRQALRMTEGIDAEAPEQIALARLNRRLFAARLGLPGQERN